mgnify:CR=1 FL=1
MICSKCGEEFVGKFCPQCGQPVFEDKVKCLDCGTEYIGNFCPNCGKPKEANIPANINQPIQVNQPQSKTQQSEQVPVSIIINNTNTNTNTNTPPNITAQKLPTPKNKWVAFFLCLFLGWFGAHKFYEGKILLGILYVFTFGLFGIGELIDLIVLLFKPNPYYL